VADTIRLVLFIEACYAAGVISDEQRAELEGVCDKTPPERVLEILTRG
jgi:hypothetical protein